MLIKEVTNAQDQLSLLKRVIDLTWSAISAEAAEEAGLPRGVMNVGRARGIGWAPRTVGKDGSYESAANLDAFKKVIAINLIGSFDCIRLAATVMSTTRSSGTARAARKAKPFSTMTSASTT